MASAKIDPDSVASWSRRYRVAEGLSQRQLARKLMTSPGVIGEMEQGRIRSSRVATALLALVPDNLNDLI